AGRALEVSSQSSPGRPLAVPSDVGSRVPAGRLQAGVEFVPGGGCRAVTAGAPVWGDLAHWLVSGGFSRLGTCAQRLCLREAANGAGAADVSGPRGGCGSRCLGHHRSLGADTRPPATAT